MKLPVVAALSLFALLVAAPRPAAMVDFKLVIPLPLTGRTANFGEIMQKSDEIAAEEINAAVAEQRKTPDLVVASAADAITRQNCQHLFRQNQVNAHYADSFVSFLAEVVKPKTIAVLYESSAFGTSGAEAMEQDAHRRAVSCSFLTG